MNAIRRVDVHSFAPALFEVWETSQTLRTTDRHRGIFFITSPYRCIQIGAAVRRFSTFTSSGSAISFTVYCSSLCIVVAFS